MLMMIAKRYLPDRRPALRFWKTFSGAGNIYSGHSPLWARRYHPRTRKR